MVAIHRYPELGRDCLSVSYLQKRPLVPLGHDMYDTGCMVNTSVTSDQSGREKDTLDAPSNLYEDIGFRLHLGFIWKKNMMAFIA